MEDHLLAVQFILIQSGGRAEQRVNAAHIHILSTPWGCTHRHTLHTFYKHAHNAEKTHAPRLSQDHKLDLDNVQQMQFLRFLFCSQ